MGSRRKPAKKGVGTPRTPAGAPRAAMVRATSIIPGVRWQIGKVARWVAFRFDSRLGARATFSDRQMMKPWRRFRSHFWPLVAALALTAIAFELADGHFIRRNIADARIEPNMIEPGKIAEFTFKAAGEIPTFDHRCGGIVRRWVIDSLGVVFTLTDVDAAEVIPVNHGSFQFIRRFPVPMAMADGSAVYHSLVTRWCNPLQEMFWPVVDSHVATFEVKR